MRRITATAATVAVLFGASCAEGLERPQTEASGESADRAPATTSTADPPTTTTARVAPTTTATTLPPGPPAVEIAIRFDQRTTDQATAGFPEAAEAILTDPRGWEQAGFRFRFTPDAPYAVVLAEPADVDAACAPYDVQSTYSCQIGPVVALNADRWRSATPTWTGTLEDYRAMLVTHEVGHLLGQHHPEVPCPTPAEPAPVMSQQSKGLNGCLANPWPLEWEISCASRHEEPIAPGYDPSASPLCGPGG